MKVKKIFLFLCILMLVPLLLSACKTEEEGLPRWYFGVEGAETKVFSTFDYGKLKETNITVERPGTDKVIVTEKMTGVHLKDVLDYLDISEYSSITLTSKDGSFVEYPHSVVEDPDTLLVFKVNGKTEWDEVTEIVQVVAKNQPEDMWLWNLATLTVNP